MKYITIQPTEVTDFITEDGTELTRLPYPFHIQEKGEVGRQDFWRGEPRRLVGFQSNLGIHRVDLWFDDFWTDPELAVGKYPVFINDNYDMWNLVTAIASVKVHDDTLRA